ncbi:YbjN domain-containing protein [Aurantimonas sp. A2-1-M11]|uniref:YbjN domain-containing protein n=1 Tax=Aurantimonas sp. A2-1-M11 TaxID=3113712 RepID=UPI002F91E86C
MPDHPPRALRTGLAAAMMLACSGLAPAGAVATPQTAQRDEQGLLSRSLAAQSGTDGQSSLGVDLLRADDLDTILDIAQGYGDADLVKTEIGDPVITGIINGVAYQLFFLDCTDGKDCEVINFYAIWDRPDITLEALNAWNRTQPFHKAYQTEEQLPVVELNLSIRGGVTRTQLTDAYDRWMISLAEFEAQILEPSL